MEGAMLLHALGLLCGLVSLVSGASCHLEPSLLVAIGPAFEGNLLLDVNAPDTFVLTPAVPHERAVAAYDPAASDSAADAGQALSGHLAPAINLRDTSASGELFADEVRFYTVGRRALFVAVNRTTGSLTRAGHLGRPQSGRLGANLRAAGGSNASLALFGRSPRRINYWSRHYGDHCHSELAVGACAAPDLRLPVQPHPDNWWLVTVDGFAAGKFSLRRPLPALFSTTLANIVLPRQLFAVYVKGLPLKEGDRGLEIDCSALEQIPTMTFTMGGQDVQVVGRHVVQRDEDTCLFQVSQSPDANIVFGLPFYETASTCWDWEKNLVSIVKLRESARFDNVDTEGRSVRRVDDVLYVTEVRRMH